MNKYLTILCAAFALIGTGCQNSAETKGKSETMKDEKAETASAQEICRYDGRLSNHIPEWKFKSSEKGEMVFVPFEGYYESKGGRIQSPIIKLEGARGVTGFYELTFKAKTQEQCYWWVDFFDADGKPLPDCNSAVYPGESREYREVFNTPPQTASIQLAFLSKAGVEVSDVVVRKITPEAAAEWCDELYAELGKPEFKVPANAIELAPKTVEALRTGKPWTVVMLGDSIVNDTYTSIFQALVKRDFPRSNVKFILSVRGSTGCSFYQDAKNFHEYVAAYEPDLVMIGGISNGVGPENIAAIGKVIDMSKALKAEVILMSPPYSIDWRTSPEKGQKWDENLGISSGVRSLLYTHQRDLAEQKNIPFFNITVPTNDYIADSGKPLNYFNRDRVHSNDRGKQIIGRVLAAYLATAKESD